MGLGMSCANPSGGFSKQHDGVGGAKGWGVYPITPTLMPTWVSHKMYNKTKVISADLLDFILI